jgi:hypothetical protein
VTAQEALKSALRDVVGPALRPHGYKGTAPNWRRSTAAGDWAVINIQSSASSSAESLSCVINLALAPEPWLRWWKEDSPRPMPKAVTETFGLYRRRLHPAGTPERVDGWWEVSDDASAVAAAIDMVAQLNEVGRPVLDRMLVDGGMLDQVRRGDLGFLTKEYHAVSFARAEALLLMDYGPSEELEEQLRRAREGCIPTQEEAALHFDTWVRNQSRQAASR